MHFLTLALFRPHMALTLCLALAWPMPTSAQESDPIPWDEECALLVSELEKRHPDLYFQADSGQFKGAMRDLGKQHLSTFEMAIRMQQLLARLGDAHTMINYTYLIQRDLILPISCYLFEDGMYVTRCPGKYREILGKKITHINAFPLEVVSDSLATLMALDNPSQLHHSLPRMLSWVQVLEYFGFAQEARVELGLENEAGQASSFTIEPGNKFNEMLRLETAETPLGFARQREFFYDSLFMEEGIHYIQYNRCWSREVEKIAGSGTSALFMPSFKEFQKAALERADQKGIEKLVLDLRFNGGGNSLQGTQFIKKLAKTRAGKEARAYLFIGRGTFSSAVINAVDCIRAFDPLILGEQSGGRPNHFGELKRFVLPESGLVVNCSSKFFTLLPDEDPPGLQVDLHTPFYFRDFKQGIDPAFEAVKSDG